jgi:hypothetical protein
MTPRSVRNRFQRAPIRSSMGTHMKTTVEIAEALLAEARQLMAREDRTLRSLIEEGLRLVLAERSRRGPEPYTFRPVVVRGEGLQPGIEEGNWDQLADLIYRGRGT